MDTGSLPGAIAGLRQCSAEMSSAVADLESSAKKNMQEFSGDAASAYANAQTQWNDGMRKLCEYLAGMADYLEMVNEGFDEREKSNADALA
jgi:WXG100 family type VII secretion target